MDDPSFFSLSLAVNALWHGPGRNISGEKSDTWHSWPVPNEGKSSQHQTRQTTKTRRPAKPDVNGKRQHRQGQTSHPHMLQEALHQPASGQRRRRAQGSPTGQLYTIRGAQKLLSDNFGWETNLLALQSEQSKVDQMKNMLKAIEMIHNRGFTKISRSKETTV